MKNFYCSLILVLFCCHTVEAQLTLTQAANEPLAGDTNKAFIVDTGLVNIATITAVSGSNALWNFSNVTILSNSVTSTVYSATTAVSSASNFPGCTMVERNTNFLKSTTSPTTQTELLGTSILGASLNFTNSAILAKYPMAVLNSFSDGFSGSVTYTSNGTFSGNINVTADGSGTLNLPNGQVFTGVLRVKTTQTTSVNGIIPFIPIVIKYTNYDYYHSSQKFPVFNVYYNSIAILTPTVSGGAGANKKSTIVGIKENTIENSALTIYPNPIISDVNFTLSQLYKPTGIKIYSVFGSIVYESNYSSKINISQLQAGIYIVEIETEKGYIRKRIIKQ